MPFGPDLKDPLWRWGAFLIGVDSFIALLAIATLGGIMLIGWWWFVALVLGLLFSMRTGRAWGQGERPAASFTRAIQPTVDVKGQAGSTYVLMEPARASKKVRPREFGPLWWTLYSVVVRAPVALGDVVLTLLWRAFGGLGGSGSESLQRSMQLERIDQAESMPQPDRDTF
jgi:hypothetical protein